MESTKINILLFAGAVCLALVSSNDCSTKMVECTGKVAEIQTKFGGMGQGGGIPSQEMISGMCKVLNDMDACYEAAAKICGDSVKASIDATHQSMAMVKSMCDPNNPCSQLKLLECSRGMTGIGQGDVNYEEICPKIAVSMNCLQTGKDNCKEPEMKAQFDQGLTSVRNQDMSCKQQLGDNYAVEAQKQGGDGTGSGDGAGSGSGSGNDGKDGGGKIVGMTGLLIIAFLFAKLAQ